MTSKWSPAEIIELLPEIELIEEASLRDKVVEAWRLVLEVSEWVRPEDAPLYPGIPVSNIAHIRAVTKCCLQVAEILESCHGYRINKGHLLAGSLLHDISKIIEYSPQGGKTPLGEFIPHGAYGVHLAIAAGLPDEVVHIVAAHTYALHTPARTIEALIVHHLDYTDGDIHALLAGEVPFSYR